PTSAPTRPSSSPISSWKSAPSSRNMKDSCYDIMTASFPLELEAWILVLASWMFAVGLLRSSLHGGTYQTFLHIGIDSINMPQKYYRALLLPSLLLQNCMCHPVVRELLLRKIRNPLQIE